MVRKRKIVFVGLLLGAAGCHSSSPFDTASDAPQAPQSAVPSMDPAVRSRYQITDAAWADFSSLYYQKQFDGIEAAVAQKLSAGLTDKSSYDLTHYLDFFDRGFSGVSEELKKSVLDEWCRTHPDSHVPWLIRGMWYIGWAWAARGTGWSNQVTEEGRRLCAQRLELAKKDFERCQELKPQDPNCSAELLVVAKGLGLDRNQMEHYFKQATSAFPGHLAAHMAKLDYLKPEWLGSEEEMGAFVRECKEKSVQYPHLILAQLEARFEGVMRLRASNDPKTIRNYWSRPDVWADVEEAYRKAIDLEPENFDRRGDFAYMAYQAGKYAAAQEQFDFLGNRYPTYTYWGTLERYHDGRVQTAKALGTAVKW